MEQNIILAAFFAKYPKFNYNPNEGPTDEYERLCTEYGWSKRKLKATRQLFQTAITQQFNENFGTQLNDLEAWQQLCRRLGVDPIPDDLKECRRIVKSTHVNLVDLVGAGTVQRFTTVYELSAYTIARKKIFPRHNIHAGDLLRHLLRHILIPSLDEKRNGNQSTQSAPNNADGQGGGSTGARRRRRPKRGRAEATTEA